MDIALHIDEGVIGFVIAALGLVIPFLLIGWGSKKLGLL